MSAFQSAFRQITQERDPFQWAATQYNLGTALLMLGQRQSGTGRLDDAVAAFRKALQEFVCARLSQQERQTRDKLEIAQKLLAERHN